MQQICNNFSPLLLTYFDYRKHGSQILTLNCDRRWFFLTGEWQHSERDRHADKTNSFSQHKLSEFNKYANAQQCKWNYLNFYRPFLLLWVLVETSGRLILNMIWYDLSFYPALHTCTFSVCSLVSRTCILVKSLFTFTSLSTLFSRHGVWADIALLVCAVTLCMT